MTSRRFDFISVRMGRVWAQRILGVSSSFVFHFLVFLGIIWAELGHE
jgi:hypothetical protein